MLIGKNKLVRQVRQVVLISRFMVSRLLVGKKSLLGRLGNLCGFPDLWLVDCSLGR